MSLKISLVHLYYSSVKNKHEHCETKYHLIISFQRMTNRFGMWFTTIIAYMCHPDKIKKKHPKPWIPKTFFYFHFYTH